MDERPENRTTEMCKGEKPEYRVWSIEYRLLEGTRTRGPEDSRCLEVGT